MSFNNKRPAYFSRPISDLFSFLALVLFAALLAAFGAQEAIADGLSPKQAGDATSLPWSGTTTPPTKDCCEAGGQLKLIAGNDAGAGFANGTSTDARFGTSFGIARDQEGNLYVADVGNNVIRKIFADGKVTTFAGSPGIRGNVDGKGEEARFVYPWGIAIDPAGNLYVTDMIAATIRKITPDGTVTTIAGQASPNGTPIFIPGGINLSHPTGIAIDASGALYVADVSNVRKIAPDGTTSIIAGRASGFSAGPPKDGPAAEASFLSLEGLALDKAGNVYVVDSGVQPGPIAPPPRQSTTSMIRKISSSGFVSTVAGTGAFNAPFNEEVTGYVDGPGAVARFRFPLGLAIDDSGNLYVGDTGNNVVRRITPDGTVTTLAGVAGQPGSSDGALAEARFSAPSGVAIEPDGSVILTDNGNFNVRRITPNGQVTTVAGAAPRPGSSDGVGEAAAFNGPTGISRRAADGALYVADTGNNTIRRIALDGTVSTVAGSPGQAGSTDGNGAARFDGPRDVAIGAHGEIFVSDLNNRTVRRIDPAGTVTTLAGAPGQAGNADGPGAQARFEAPLALDVDIHGNVYLIDRGNGVRKITPEGIVSTVGAGNPEILSQLAFSDDIAVDRADNLYIVRASTIFKLTPEGVLTTVREGVPSPQGFAVDASDNLYFGDYQAIRRLAPDGTLTTVAGVTEDGQQCTPLKVPLPRGLAVTGDKSLVFTAGDGVFELQLP